MSLKRKIAFSILSSQPAALLWKSARSNVFRILAYHRVLDQDLASFPYDEGVVSATSESFYRQMKFAKENFDVITFLDLVKCQDESRPLPNRALIVTFDDGYLDNYTNAFPILKDLGIRATIFLAAAHMDSRELFWWDKISYCIKHSQERTFKYERISPDPLPLETVSDRSRAITVLLKWIKKVPEEVKAEFLGSLPSLTGCSTPQGHERMHVNWDEVREMADFGIEFGSHTLSHPILPNVSAAELEREIVGSKQRIEERLGRQVVSFAYPVGRFNSHVESVVRKAGYRFAVSFDEGTAEVRSTNQFLLPRIHVDPEVTFNHFRSVLMFPQIVLR